MSIKIKNITSTPESIRKTAEEHSSLLEDIDLANNSKFISKMKQADREFKSGKFFTWESVKKNLAEKR
ncbi:MAG: hypothetical protein Q7R78_02555 [bacterium]|nr:hypothetical protein [bacterium]